MDQRSFIILNLPISPTEPITHPEKIVIQFPNNRSLDLGALCYLKRKHPKGIGFNVRTRKKVKSRPVDPSSFYPQRTKHVEKLVRYLSEQISVSGKRLETVRNTIGRFIPFMDWADQNNHTRVLDGVEFAKASINDYLKHLLERVKFEEIVFSSAISQQEAVISVLSDYFNIDNFSHGLPLLRNHLCPKNPTSPPDEKRSSDALSLSERLFDNIFCFVWNFKKYPYPIVVPEHYKYPKNTLWIFPANSWFKPAYKPMSLKNGAYNYSEGKLYTLKEMIANSPNTHKSKLSESIDKAQEALICANADRHNTHRLLLAQLALHCFVIMFQAETGMNWSQLVNMPWTGEYESVSERQLFRVIKWRANNKEVYFEITSAFLPKFKKFLNLREYLLRDKEFSFLFFKLNIEINNIQPPTQLAEHQVSTYTILKRIHPDLTYIKNREWRAAKSDWLIRNTDPSTTALILQNSEKTVLAHYAAGSETTQIRELSKFLNGLSNSVLKKGESPPGAVNQPIGTCSDYLSPSQTIQVKNISSDCSNLEGCFFCAKFRVHADEIDTRKLLSCRYCLERLATNYQGDQFYESSIQPLLNRINAILHKISEKDPELFYRISESVELNGELEFYWAQKFQMLLELEIII